MLDEPWHICMEEMFYEEALLLEAVFLSGFAFREASALCMYACSLLPDSFFHERNLDFAHSKGA